jgi:LmbE family N-acetylglucosaminyl deacetylase
MTSISASEATSNGARPGQSALVLSPHLDDGVLSCALTILALRTLGLRVHVLTVFAGQPAGPLSAVAARFHAACGQGPQAIAERRQEDRQALAVLGAEPRHLNYLDVVYRRCPDGSWRCTDDDDPFRLHPADEPALQADLTDRVASILHQRRPAWLLLPLAAGGHIDHQLSRHAGRAAVASLPDGPRPQVLLYEDIPYAHHEPCEGLALADHLRPVVTPTSTDGWSRKVTAIGCYRSQVRMLWQGASDWPDRLREYADHLGHGHPAERLWQARSSRTAPPWAAVPARPGQ